MMRTYDCLLYLFVYCLFVLRYVKSKVELPNVTSFSAVLNSKANLNGLYHFYVALDHLIMKLRWCVNTDWHQ